MRVTLMHNPESGDGDSSREEIIGALRRVGYSVTYQSTKEKGYADALEDPGEFIVVAGGDGTIEKIARRMAGRSTPLALLPSGTANNVALSLNVSTPFEELIAGWDLDRVRRIDLCLVKTPWDEGYFLESVGLGAFADLIARADAEPVPGDSESRVQEFAAAYRLLEQIVRSASTQNYSIHIDGVEYSGEFLIVQLMNMRFIGPNLALSTLSDPSDGQIELVTVSEPERTEFVRFLREIEPGSEQTPPVTVRRGSEFEVEWADARLHVDDEIWPESDEDPDVAPAAQKSRCLEVRVVPGALTFLA